MHASDPARPYFQTPSLAPDGLQIAFVYAGDIWLIARNGGEAQRLTAHPSTHSYPRWSHTGDQIAFTSNRSGHGDIYILPLHGGETTRVTFHDAPSYAECWSHDDTALYFRSARDRQDSAIYRVPVTGSTPIAWITQPYETLSDVTLSPDGSQLALAIVRERWWRRGPNPYGTSEIWLCPNTVDQDVARRVGNAAGLNRWPLWLPDASGIYLVSDRDGTPNVWLQPLDDQPARQITHFVDGRLLWPSISRDGATIVFERDFGLWQLDTQSGEVAPIEVRVRSDRKSSPVQVHIYNRMDELVLAPDGKKLAFITHGEVFVDFADKETDKDLRQGSAFRVTNTSARERDVIWSPDSRKLAYLSDRHGDRELYSYSFATRSETRLTNQPISKSNPAYSPDGNWLAYASGSDQIRLIDTRTNEDTLFVQADLDFQPALAWSPDGTWLVFAAQDTHHFQNLYVQRIGEQQAHQITFLSNLTTTDPLWAPNGQFIICTTGQYRAEMQIACVDLRPPQPTLREAEFDKLFETKSDEPKKANDERPADPPDPKPTSDPATPPSAMPSALETAPQQPSSASEPVPAEPKADDAAPTAQAATSEEKAKPKNLVEITFDGIDRRLRLLTPPQLDGRALCISADSRDLIFRGYVTSKANLWTLPLDEPRADQPPRQITASGTFKSAAQFAPDGKNFWFLDGGQIAFRKFPAGDQTTPQYSGEVQIHFEQEKWQIFNECWTNLRDHFYDASFRGLDWQAIREQYRPLIAGCQTEYELMLLLNLMMGELNTSHLGLGGGGGGGSDGYTGLLFDRREQHGSGRLLVATVLPESPAALAGIPVGSELLAVEGQAVAGANLDTLLQRTIGRRVRLRITGPGDQAERDVVVRPAAGHEYHHLRYRAWVQENEALVHAASGGKLGYVHIPEMSYDAYQQFLVDLDAETYGKQGLLIDIRNNHGGHTATFFIDVLTRRSVLLKSFRGQIPSDAGHLAGNRVLNRPTVLITNENSVSNAEMFSETYRRLGVGRVVGKPTAGAVISTWRPQLLNGLSMGLPRMRVTTIDGEDLEGTGRAVDVDVALPLGDPGRGRDPQLESAVRVLMEQIQGNQ